MELKTQKCRWGRLGDISGGFHIGVTVDWEPWLITLGLSVGFWSLELLIQIPFPLREDKAEIGTAF